jgi:DNA-binding IclR family transcriptional regulator
MTHNYARVIEELLPGFSVLAAPVMRSRGEIAAVISVTLPTETLLKPGQEKYYVSLIQAGCHRAALQLGFQPAHGNA